MTRPVRQSSSTVIVGIDQKSYGALLARHGPLSAWPRTLYAQALDALTVAGPRVVAFAVFFDAPRAEDAELAAAMRRAGAVVLPVLAQGPRGFDPRPGVAQEFESLVGAAPVVRGAAAAEGVANITTERDSVVRGLPLLLSMEGDILPSLALTIVARHARRPAVLDGAPGPGVVFGAGRAIPLAERDTMLINFLGPPSLPRGRGPFRIISFVDVLERRFDPTLVRDRIVLIGPTIRGVDEHATPTTRDTRMWGVEILGSAVESILHQRYLAPVPRGVAVAAIAVLALLGAGLAALWRPLLAGIGVLGVLALYVMVAAALFETGRLIDLVFPPVALLLAFLAALGYRVVVDEAEQRVLQDAMARYLSPTVSRWVLEDLDRLRLGGELREMTVLFSDIRRFTTLTHELPPETVVSLLNLYRTDMTECVFGEDGVLAQFAGDAIEAFWNAPMDQSDHAARACAAAAGDDGGARAAPARVRAPRLARPGHGGGPQHRAHGRGQRGLPHAPRVHRGGRCRQRRGPARGALEGVRGPRRGGRDDANRGGLRLRVSLSRRRGGGRPGDAADRVRAARSRRQSRAGRALRGARYHEAIALYRARRWREAATLFDELAASAPSDGPIAVYRRRSHDLLAHPPPPDWDGVYLARVK